ncbi:hypothetical protein Syun_007069 [Stephania yunnanensis]|uniref:Uncharacterized protein n=1 Tax=Stephania yunnanensis TaxID=152371 RepID=A0AAP0KZB2_9MAGN
MIYWLFSAVDFPTDSFVISYRWLITTFVLQLTVSFFIIFSSISSFSFLNLEIIKQENI